MNNLGFKFLVGLLSGVVAWALIEPTKPGATQLEAWGSFEHRLILVLGALIGLSVGALDGWARGGRTHVLRGLLLGLVFGAVGASFGYGVGGEIAERLFGGVIQGRGLLVAILSRSVALTPLGIFLGAAIGASSLNPRKIVQGAIGGGLGAALGSVLFDVIGSIFSEFTLSVNGMGSGQVGEVGTIPRAIYCGALGALIGLFIGLVERFSRRAWLRLQLGRNEGKEWAIDAPQIFIGRSEGASVPLFGDPNVAPIHASIQRQGQNYVLMDGGSPIGTYVNGQRIQSVLLFPGAMIQIGSFALQFQMRNATAAAPGMAAPGMAAYPAGYPMGNYPRPGGMAAPPGPQPMPGSPMAPHMAPGQMAPGPQMAPGYGAPQPVQTAGLNQTIAYGTAQPAPQPAPTMGAMALVALDGPLAGQRFPVVGPIDLGRESPAVPMPYDGQASRRHASVAPGLGGVTVTDLGSTNGTYVNGQRIQSAAARPGDLIKVGGTTFRVEA